MSIYWVVLCTFTFLNLVGISLLRKEYIFQRTSPSGWATSSGNGVCYIITVSIITIVVILLLRNADIKGLKLVGFAIFMAMATAHFLGVCLVKWK